MNIACKCRMYPDHKQCEQAIKTLGSCRYVYNLFLDVWNTTYKYTGSGMSYNSCSASMTELKKVLPWLKNRIPSLWTRSYFCCTIGHISEDTIRRYIEEQKHA